MRRDGTQEARPLSLVRCTEAARKGPNSPCPEGSKARPTSAYILAKLLARFPNATHRALRTSPAVGNVSRLIRCGQLMECGTTDAKTVAQASSRMVLAIR